MTLTRMATATAENQMTFIGKCNFRGNERIFGIKQNDRRQHTYVIGKTGVGKTVLLKNMALQDIRAGRGVCIIDPHGEFVNEVLGEIPPERSRDVVYFNPVDEDYPIGFNVLEVPDSKYKHLVVSDLLGIFTKIWANVWSARMEYILQNCIMALLDTPGTTLLGIPRLLVDKDYRQTIVANVKDPVVKSFWVHEFETWREQFRNEAIVPIQNKVNQFLNTSFIRNIVGQPKSSLNIPAIMNEGKILLVDVSKGKLGEDNSALLGAMVITKIQLASMERVRILEEDRLDFYLYVDEFQNFATDSFASILSEARKYRLNLIIAHQYVGQLVTDVSTKVRDAVFGNVGTMIVFRVGAIDAEFLEKEFMPEFMQLDLINLPNHNIYLKLMVDGVSSRPFSAATLPPIRFESDPSIKETVIRISRERYARPKLEVVAEIAAWSGIVGNEDARTAVLHDATCWNCGKTATVPFKPDGKRPVYCLTCLKQIEEGKLIPLPERMPQVGRARFGETLSELGIEFEAAKRVPAKTAPAPAQVMASRKTEERRIHHSPTGEVGIRHLPPGGTYRRERHQHPEFKPPAGGIRSRPVVRAAPGAKPLSLSELKGKEIDKEKEKKIDLEGLRRTLEEVRRENQEKPEKQNPAVEVRQHSLGSAEGGTSRTSTTGQNPKEKKVIEPGEKIKF